MPGNALNMMQEWAMHATLRSESDESNVFLAFIPIWLVPNAYGIFPHVLELPGFIS